MDIKVNHDLTVDIHDKVIIEINDELRNGILAYNINQLSHFNKGSDFILGELTHLTFSFEKCDTKQGFSTNLVYTNSKAECSTKTITLKDFLHTQLSEFNYLKSIAYFKIEHAKNITDQQLISMQNDAAEIENQIHNLFCVNDNLDIQNYQADLLTGFNDPIIALDYIVKNIKNILFNVINS